MSKWKDRQEYWEDVGSRLSIHLAKSVHPDVAAILLESLKFFSFYAESLPSKITVNKTVAPKLDLFVVFAQDQLRAAQVLYNNLNLSPAAISARASFENCVSQRFIVKNNDPAKFANLYNRYKDIIKLKGHRNSLFLAPLAVTEEAKILAANPEWLDTATGKLVKKPHWTAIKGISFEQMVQQVQMSEYYSLYRSTSNFVHASPITLNMYNSANGFGAISTEIHSRRMCLLIAIFTLETLIDYCEFFKVAYDENEYFAIVTELNRLTA